MYDTFQLPEILLVEDNADDEALALRALSRTEVACRVNVRRDGAEALDALFGRDPLPALVLLDFNLPRFNGLEVLTRMRDAEATRLIPVVIFSGTVSGEALCDCYRVGANSCICKPTNPKEYSDTIGWIAHYWLNVNLRASTETARVAIRLPSR